MHIAQVKIGHMCIYVEKQKKLWFLREKFTYISWVNHIKTTEVKKKHAKSM